MSEEMSNYKKHRWMLPLYVGSSDREVEQFKGAIQKFALRNNRNVSNQVVHILSEKLREEGLL